MTWLYYRLYVMLHNLDNLNSVVGTHVPKAFIWKTRRILFSTFIIPFPKENEKWY